MLIILLHTGCSWSSEESPEVEVLENRTAALINIGWQWLHAENMVVSNIDVNGERASATCRYDVVLDTDVASLPPELQEHYYKFLPWCRERAKMAGDRCHVSEDMQFVFTEEFSWMPEPAVLYAPNLLSEIAAWRAGANAAARQKQ